MAIEARLRRVSVFDIVRETLSRTGIAPAANIVRVCCVTPWRIDSCIIVVGALMNRIIRNLHELYKNFKVLNLSSGIRVPRVIKVVTELGRRVGAIDVCTTWNNFSQMTDLNAVHFAKQFTHRNRGHRCQLCHRPDRA